MNYGSEPTPSHGHRFPLSKIRNELLAIHGPKCAYCGVDVTVGQITLDAFLPYRAFPEAQGPDNYVLACPYCNSSKGSMRPLSQDGQEQILHPYSDRYKNEIRINKDGIAEGLTEAGKSTVGILNLNRPELVSYRKDHIADFIERVNDKNSAYDVYKCSINQIKELLKIQIVDSELQEYYRRMIYANVIASMEAYLSKTIITLVLNDETVFWRFVNRFDWGKEKIGIECIKEVYDNMNIRVQTKLTEVLYHNLPKVKAMYEKILEIEILQNDEDMAFLCQSVDIRHDLVHRNGRKTNDRETDEFHAISFDMIAELIDHVDRLVEEIEQQKSSNTPNT